jgi:uroporphyrinogen-III decarboxylase
MTSRERVKLALEHKEADRIPVDVGGTTATSLHVRMVYLLRQALGLDKPGTPVKVVEPYQMLGEVTPDLTAAMGSDVISVGGTGTAFGFKLEGWKQWMDWDGSPALVPAGFNTIPEADGDLLLYPQGDRSVAASGRMPRGGFYFDSIVRQRTVDEDNLRVEDNLEEYEPISDAEVELIASEVKRLYAETDKAIVLNAGVSGIGTMGKIAGPSLRYPKGIRDIEEWCISLSTRPQHIYQIFEGQTAINLKSLEKLHRAVGDQVTAIFMTGTDFGAQNGPFISPKTYRELFLPFHRILNDWVHEHTPWKTFIHSCGSVWALVEDFITAGFDILNPVQCSAADMDPMALKRKFGDRITFWGGGVDTQKTLPFGTPDEVRKEVRERLRAFGPGGGYVFATVHNIQALVPIENILAMFETTREYGAYH